MKITGSEPAMPTIVEENTIEDHLGTVMQMHFPGLTIRQHFAAMAMQGLMACNEKGSNEWEEAVKKAAKNICSNG